MVSALIDKAIILLDDAELTLLEMILLDKWILHHSNRFHCLQLGIIQRELSIAIESFDLVNTASEPLVVAHYAFVACPLLLIGAYASSRLRLEDLWYIKVRRRLMMVISLSKVSV